MNEVITKAKLLCAWVDEKNVVKEETELSFSESESDSDDSKSSNSNREISNRISVKSSDNSINPILAPGYIHTLSDVPVVPSSVQLAEIVDDSLYSQNSMIQTHLAKSRIAKDKKINNLVTLNEIERRKVEKGVDIREGKMYEDMVGLGMLLVL